MSDTVAPTELFVAAAPAQQRPNSLKPVASTRTSETTTSGGTVRLIDLASIVEALPGGVIVLDAGGAVALTNQEISRQFGFSREKLVGQPVQRLIPGFPPADRTDRESHSQAAAAVAAAPRSLETFAQRVDGSRFPIEIALSTMGTDEGTFVIASLSDITARQALDRANRLSLEGQLEFERLVAGLSRQFINLPADQVDAAMRAALQQIGEALGLDSCQFFRIEEDGTSTAPVGWQRQGGPPPPPPVPTSTRFPWVFETIMAGRVLSFSRLEEIPNSLDRQGYRALGIRSSVTVPLSVANRIVGAVGFNVLREERQWTPEIVHRLQVFAAAFGNVLARRESDEALRLALLEVERLRDELHAENVYLRAEARDRLRSNTIVGQSAALRSVLAQVQQVAATNSTVLLIGETGTGKELFATQIHELSARRERTMVRVNCGAIPATLLESEMFGREKGAFTGALSRQVGRFELADKSTIFLDEIGDLPAEVQVKLLRVIEERQVERLGSPRPIQVDTRIIAATHRNLEQRIADGAFREDLFYRLNVFPISVPPLRERAEDIPLLVWRFVEEFSRLFGKPIDAIPRESMTALQRYSWPGNIRELRNVVERAMIVSTGRRLSFTLPSSTATAEKRSLKLIDVDREHIRSVLESTNWRVRGVGGAAERLGMRPTTLETRLAKLGLKRPKTA